MTVVTKKAKKAKTASKTAKKAKSAPKKRIEAQMEGGSWAAEMVIEVPLSLPQDAVLHMKRIAELSRSSLDVVINVLLAASLAASEGPPRGDRGR